MTMRALALILGLGLELAMAAAPVRAVQDEDGQVRVRTGIACDRSSGAPLYREIHKERWVEGRLVEDRVSYHRPDGNEFAAKRVDYRASAIAPEFELADAASGHEEALQRIGDTLVVRYRASQDAPERSATLPATGGLIADAGFERFVLRHWDRLAAGEAMVQPFLIPSRLGPVDMRLRRRHRAENGKDSEVAFELTIDSVLLRLVVPAVRVIHDASTRTLRRYEGISNLRDADGRNLDVIITFHAGTPADSSCRP